jgi:hypothetical protein
MLLLVFVLVSLFERKLQDLTLDGRIDHHRYKYSVIIISMKHSEMFWVPKVIAPFCMCIFLASLCCFLHFLVYFPYKKTKGSL